MIKKRLLLLSIWLVWIMNQQRWVFIFSYWISINIIIFFSDNLICNVCQKSYSSVSAKNRHLRTVHHEAVEEKPKNTVHIQCPICNEQEKPSFGSHDLLISHLENNHSLSIKTSFYKFRTMEEFETWRALISRSVDYVVNSTHITQSTNTKRIYYNCNRSNYRGWYAYTYSLKWVNTDFNTKF